jgi:HAD superfamily hydrolase (TIGR01549 family)
MTADDVGRALEMWTPIDRQAYQRFRALVQGPRVKVVSVDVFDTLLLRTTRPEEQRFEDIAARQLAALRSAGHELAATPRDVLNLRLQAARSAKRDTPPVLGDREASYDQIAGALLDALGLNRDLVPLLRDCEIEYEAANLYPNHLLIEILSGARQAGKRVICLSDMYLSNRDIGELLRRRAEGYTPDAIYVSADFGYGKASGHLYWEVARRESVEPEEIVHCGDNRRADVEMARSQGFGAVHAPRPLRWRGLALLRRLAFATRRRLAAP